MARIWSEINREIHHVPRFRFSGTIDFDHGTYNITEYTKEARTFNTHLIMELWQGFPNEEGARRLERLFYYNYDGAASASYSAKTWAANGRTEYVDGYVSVKFQGTFPVPPAGQNFYIVSFCGSHKPRFATCANVNESNRYIYPFNADWIDEEGRDRMALWLGQDVGDDYWQDMGKAPYWISANQALVPTYKPGSLHLDLSASGTTITASVYYTGENVYYAKSDITEAERGMVAVYIDGTKTDPDHIKYLDLAESDTPGAAFCQFTSAVGLKPNTNHTITAEVFEQNDAGEPNRIVTHANITTYRCIAWPGSHTDSTITYNYHVSNNYHGDVYYWTTPYAAEDFLPDTMPYSLIPNPRITTTDSQGWGTITLDSLEVGTKIRIFVAPVDIKNERGELDAIGSTTDTTWMPTSFEGMDVVMTGTTITMTPMFTTGDEGDVEWKATLGKDTVSGVGSADKAKFRLLANGQTYTIVFRGLYANAAYVPEELKDDDEENDDTETEDGEKISDLYQLEMEFLNTEVYYSVRTYAVQLKQREIGTNSYSCTIYQTPGAAGEEYKKLIEHMYYPYDAYCTRRDGNVDNGVHVGYVSIEDQHATVYGLEPSTNYRLYVWLNGCKDFEGYSDAVAYIDFTTKPVLTTAPFNARVTGRTVTVTPIISRWNGSESLSYIATIYRNNVLLRKGLMRYCDPSEIETAVFTGLENGTEYTIKFFGLDNNMNEIDISDLTVVTYGIEITDEGDVYTRSLRNIEIKYTDGEKSSAVSQDPSRGSFVKWWVVSDETDSLVDGREFINCRRSNPYRFNTNNRLLPYADYTLYAEVDGVEYEGENDTQISYSFTTLGPAFGYRVDTDTTGETLCVIPTWVDSDSPYNEVTCTLTLMLGEEIIDTKVTKDKNKPVWFVNLLRGTRYEVIFTAVDNEGNTTSDYIFYYGNDDVNYNPGGHTHDITYKLTIHDFDFTTRSLKWTCSTSKTLPNSKYVEYYIDQGPEDVKIDYTETMYPEQIVKYLKLYDNTTTVLRYRIQDMRDQKGKYDTEEEVIFKTKELTLSINGCTPHVDHVFIHCQAYADGEAYDRDYISNTNIAFVDELCHNTPVREGKGTVGDNSGTYSVDKTRRFDGLTGGREYYFNVGVTDGMNETDNTAEDMAPFYTLVELIRIYHNGRYWTALPFVFHTGEWYRAPAYLYGTRKRITKWWHTNPERDYPVSNDDGD